MIVVVASHQEEPEERASFLSTPAAPPTPSSHHQKHRNDHLRLQQISLTVTGTKKKTTEPAFAGLTPLGRIGGSSQRLSSQGTEVPSYSPGEN